MKIILFDDHELFRKSLALALQSPNFKLETYGNDVDILGVIGSEKPDVVLMDINLGNKDGIDEGEKILAEYPDIKLIFLSGYSLPGYHEAAVKMGAKAFIEKSSSIDLLLTKVNLVIQGNTIFPEYDHTFEELSSKETQILQLVAEGNTQQEIADLLYISRRTISTHMQHILDKMNVHTTVQAIVRGIELGIVRIKL